MDLKIYTNPIGEKVDAKSEELMIEFDRHFADLVEAHPEHEDKRDLAFQAWSIQKIAGLQLCVSELERRIADMQKE